MANTFFNRFNSNPSTEEEFNNNLFEALKEVYLICDEIKKIPDFDKMEGATLSTTILEFGYKALRLATNFSDINSYLDFEFSLKQETAAVDNLVHLRETLSHSFDQLYVEDVLQMYHDILRNLEDIRSVCTKYFPKEILINEDNVYSISTLLNNYFPADTQLKNKYTEVLQDAFLNKNKCYSKKFENAKYEQAINSKRIASGKLEPKIFYHYPTFHIRKNLSNVNIYAYELAKLFYDISGHIDLLHDIPAGNRSATIMQCIVLAEGISRIGRELDKNLIKSDPKDALNNLRLLGNYFTHSNIVLDDEIEKFKSTIPLLNNQMRQHLPAFVIENPNQIQDYNRSVLRFFERSLDLTPQQSLDYTHALRQDFLSKSIPSRNTSIPKAVTTPTAMFNAGGLDTLEKKKSTTQDTQKEGPEDAKKFNKTGR